MAHDVGCQFGGNDADPTGAHLVELKAVGTPVTSMIAICDSVSTIFCNTDAMESLAAIVVPS
jgi:hypothetical protein